MGGKYRVIWAESPFKFFSEMKPEMMRKIVPMHPWELKLLSIAELHQIPLFRTHSCNIGRWDGAEIWKCHKQHGEQAGALLHPTRA